MNLSENTDESPKIVAINSCRLCLSIKSGSSMIYMFGEQAKKREILELVNYCTGIQIHMNPILPQFVCKDCYAKLEVAKLIKEKSLQSDEYLKKFESEMQGCDEEAFVEEDNPVEIDKPDTPEEAVEIKLEPEDPLKPEEPKSEIVSSLESDIKFEITEIQEVPESFQAETESTESESEKGNPPCPFCFDVFAGTLSTKTHVYKGDLKNYHCPSCGLKVNNLTCCNKKLRHINYLKAHFRTVHLKIAKFHCKICNIRFIYKPAYETHLLLHNPTEKIYYECDLCDSKKYTRKQTLEDHMLVVHLKTKNFYCKFCKRYYVSRYSLELHKTTNLTCSKKYNNVVKRDLECPFDGCNKKFHTNHNLSIHTKLVHLKIPQYFCKYCEANFLHITTYKHHIQLHEKSGKKEFIKKHMRKKDFM